MVSRQALRYVAFMNNDDKTPFQGGPIIREEDLLKPALMYRKGEQPQGVYTHATLQDALTDTGLLHEQERQQVLIKIEGKPPFSYGDFRSRLAHKQK